MHASFALQSFPKFVSNLKLGPYSLRSLLLREMRRACNSWDSVLKCTLQPFPKFVSNLKISPSSFPFLVTKLSDHAFYRKRAMHATFGLACTLQPFPKFVGNLKIGPSSFCFLVTKLSDHSFYWKRAVHATSGLACSRAHSNYFQNL